MEERLSRESLIKLMKFDRKELYRDPFNFDCPPPVYDSFNTHGWTTLAKAILTNEKEFK